MDKNGRLGFCQDQWKTWKEHMVKIMNEENYWDHMWEADLVEGPVEQVIYKRVVEAIKKTK